MTDRTLAAPPQNSSTRFNYVKYDESSIRKQEAFKRKFEELEEMAQRELPVGRAQSLFLTAIEEAYMWTGKAIRDAQMSSGSQTEHVPARG